MRERGLPQQDNDRRRLREHVQGDQGLRRLRLRGPVVQLWRRHLLAEVALRPQADPGLPCRRSGEGLADIPSKYALNVSASSTPLVAYPRPQMVRGAGSTSALREVGDPAVWTNLNGLWEWEATTGDTAGRWTGAPPFGKTLSGSILVPFPVESCLSGVAPNSSRAIVKSMWYRLKFDAQGAGGHATLLHFGAVDWKSTVFLNGKEIGNNTGGYNGFDFDISSEVKASGNELLVYVFDPSDSGKQPNGKQRISAIDNPGGDTYTPSSGIWQTVWLEEAPAHYIKNLKIDQASTTAVSVTVEGSGAGSAPVTFTVMDGGKSVATASGTTGTKLSISIPSPKLWSTTSPHLYDLQVKMGTDTVTSYFGLRTFELGDGPKGKRPLLNGKFTFAAGFLDQSWWPDGQYTAPTDEGLAYDVEAVPMFGLNMIRLHQKVNPEVSMILSLPPRLACLVYSPSAETETVTVGVGGDIARTHAALVLSCRPSGRAHFLGHGAKVRRR